MDIKEKLNRLSENKKTYVILLTILIAFQVMVVTYFFAFEKEGYHSDEVWSYGLANSFYEPFIYGDALSFDVSKCHKWVDGTDFKDYLTVQRGEQFRYDSVWYNQSMDMHPPLFYTILHTICSFFPDTFSKWFGFAINIAAMIIGQIFLAKTGYTATKSKVFAYLLCALWGFSCGFLNLNVFVRMYSLSTMFAILLLYSHCRLYYNEGSVKSNLIKIFVFSFCGALTHHYFIIAAFGIAACFCFYYLFKKQFKKMLAYAFTMLGSIGLSIAVFPATIHHLFFMENTESRLATQMPLINGFRSCVAIVLNSITGIYISSFATWGYAYVVAAVVAIAVLSIPLCFLFRNEEWFIRFKEKTLAALKSAMGKFDFFLLFAFISVVFTMLIISLTVNINVMSMHTDRYLFVIMPWAAFVLIMAARYILTWIKPLKKFAAPITAVCVCAAIVGSHILCEKRYLFPRMIMGEGALEDTCTENSEYVAVTNYEWLITCFTDKLMTCGRVFPTTVYTYENDLDEISKMDLSKDCYILIDSTQLAKWDVFTDNNVDNEVDFKNFTFKVDPSIFDDYKREDDVIADFEEIFPGYKIQFCSSEMIMGEMMHTFKLVPESEYIDVPIIDADILEKQAANAENSLSEGE